MQGRITTRHLVTHGQVIVEEFGWRVFFRCLQRCVFRRGPATFLGIVSESSRSPFR